MLHSRRGWLADRFPDDGPPRVWSPVNNLWASLVMLGGGAQILHERSRRKKIRDYIQELQKQRAAGKPLHDRHRDHALVGRWRPSRDGHVGPDWILLYTADETTLRLERTGTHSYLFKK